MLKNLSDNLNLLMAKARLTSSELAKQIGIPATTIKRIRNNEQANPTLTTLLPIANYFSVSLNKLIGDESFDLSDWPSKHRQIPLLSWQDCINLSSLEYDKQPKKVSTERKVSPLAFALTVENSESNLFPNGSILLIEPQITAENGDYVIAAHTAQNIATIRKYIIEIDQIYLKPLLEGADVSILTPQIKIIGVIMQYKKELKL